MSLLKQAEIRWHCQTCGHVITTTGSRPDKKAGGPCQNMGNGDHNWYQE